MYKNKLNLNYLNDCIEYSRDKGWLKYENEFNKKTRKDIKFYSKSIRSGYYINKIQLYPGDILKISNNICKIICYNNFTKKHLIMILNHPNLRTTNIYLNLTIFSVISTKNLRNDILTFKKNYLYKIKSRNTNYDLELRMGLLSDDVLDNSYEMELDDSYEMELDYNKKKLNIITYKNDNNFKRTNIAYIKLSPTINYKEISEKLVNNMIQKNSDLILSEIHNYINDSDSNDDSGFNDDNELDIKNTIYIQSIYRGYLMRKKYKQIKKSVRIIQYFFRKYINIANKNLEENNYRCIIM